MVWVVSRFRLKAPPGISSSYISPLTTSGQRSRASRASQPQKSATLSPQPRGKTTKFLRTCGGGGKKKIKAFTSTPFPSLLTNKAPTFCYIVHHVFTRTINIIRIHQMLKYPIQFHYFIHLVWYKVRHFTHFMCL